MDKYYKQDQHLIQQQMLLNVNVWNVISINSNSKNGMKKYSPDSAVRKINPFENCANRLNLMASFDAFITCGEVRLLRHDQKNKEYNNKAEPRCAANLYWETLGTSDSPWNRSSKPDFTMYQPNRP